MGHRKRPTFFTYHIEPKFAMSLVSRTKRATRERRRTKSAEANLGNNG
jgi:hypothetical protein